jgi:hypothetical protein
MNPLDVKLTRQKILTEVVKHNDMKQFISSLIEKKWFKYCHCPDCKLIVAYKKYLGV